MRIGLVGPVYPYRGGIAHYTALLYRALRDRGHEVLMISFKRQYPKWLYPGKSDKDPSKGALEVEDAKYWIDSLNPLSWLMTFRRIRTFDPQCLILQWWTPFWAPVWFVLGMLNRVLLRKPLVYICHNVRLHEAKIGYRLVTRSVLGLGQSFIVHSQQEREELLRVLPAADVKVRPLPRFSLFSAGGVSRAMARQTLGLPAQAPIFLFFGIVRPYKGLRDLVVAFSMVRRELRDAMLLVAGEFWEPRGDYEKLIETLGIQDAVRLDDRYIPDEDLMMYLSAADLVVAPYRSVTGSAVVQTARAFGLPVITTRTGGLPELAVGDEHITLVNVGDEAALADALTREYRYLGLDSVASRSRPEDDWEFTVTALESLAAELS